MKRLYGIYTKYSNLQKGIQTPDSADLIQSTDKYQDELICSICRDYIMIARVTICGHTFCFNCLTEWLVASKNCPICRTEIYNSCSKPSHIIDSLVMNVAISAGIQQRLNFEARKEECDKYYKSLKVQNIKEQSLVDVRDLNYIWNAGIVGSIVTLKNQEKYALIEYIGLDDIYNEYISIDSDRLASFGFYTNREELPKYVKMNENIYIFGLNENNNEAQLVADSDEHISEIMYEYPEDEENDITNYINALRG